MKLVEAEAEGPVEGEDAIVTPPRPPHRRVSVSLVFTLSVLIGTVVTIYVVFPARKSVLVEEALDRHREATPAWDLAAPTLPELRAWAIGVVGPGVPLPIAEPMKIVGARRLHVLNRNAALVRLDVDGAAITYVVQHARGIAPRRDERHEGDLRAVAWWRGPWSCAAVGPEATAQAWLRAITRE
jgi:hypothetical protein